MDEISSAIQEITVSVNHQKKGAEEIDKMGDELVSLVEELERMTKRFIA